MPEQTEHDIVEAMLPMTYRLALAKTLDPADAEDITQDVMLRYLQYRPAFESAEHTKAWFIRVTVQRVADFWRQNGRHRETLSLDAPLNGDTDRRTTFADTLPTADDWPAVELGFDLARAMARLKPQEREILHLYYYENLSGGEIADILQRRAGTVRMQLKRARAALKTAFGSDPDAGTDAGTAAGADADRRPAQKGGR